jgi:hypothetical protein
MNSLNLKPADMDRLGQALLTLTKELWVVKDRLRVMESALSDAGVMPPDAVDSYQPGKELSALLATERAELINQIIDTLAPDSE